LLFQVSFFFPNWLEINIKVTIIKIKIKLVNEEAFSAMALSTNSLDFL
jgi:hypothetical protein